MSKLVELNSTEIKSFCTNDLISVEFFLHQVYSTVVIKIASKVDVCLIFFLHNLQLLSNHFFCAKCMTSCATFLLLFEDKRSLVVDYLNFYEHSS